MALFPKCTFEVLLPRGGVRAGERFEGELVLKVPEPIPRAEHVDLRFCTMAVAGYGSGKNRSVFRRELLSMPMHVDLPKGQPLAAGEHRFPFAMDMPAWLPPNYSGSDCSISNTIEVRLDVDWALDPHTRVAPVISLMPQHARGMPIVVRSPAGFHESLVLEVTLDSATVAQGEPLTGRIALRGGHQARFDALVVSFVGCATIHMGRGDRRLGGGRMVRIPAADLRTGESVPFVFRIGDVVPPAFRNGFIDHDALLRITADIPWASDPSFDVPVHLLPAGSSVEHDAGQAGPVGAMRLRSHAQAMASATGLAQGRLPTLVEGRIGPVAVSVSDGPRSGNLGVDIDLTFPDIELGTVFRPLGMLEGFRQSPLLPRALGDRYLLRAEEGTRHDAEALGAFYGAVLGSLGAATDVRFSDHHLGVHYPMANDSGEQMTEIAWFAVNHAKAIEGAIRQLPFPPALANGQPAWTATAGEQAAFLVPHVPALHGVVFQMRVLAGEIRSMRTIVRTEWRKDVPMIVVHADLREAPLTKTARTEIDEEKGLAPVRQVFPTIHATSDEKVTVETAAWSPDPRTLFPALEQLFAWVLEQRGERRVDLPYR